MSKPLVDRRGNIINCSNIGCPNAATRYVDTAWWMKTPCCDSEKCEDDLAWVISSKDKDGKVTIEYL